MVGVSAQDDHHHQQRHSGSVYNEEFDPFILDSINVFGSPYGGFSRATRSRLASLPLRLPDQIVRGIDQNDNKDEHKNKADENSHNNNNNALYWEISDGLGQQYACRSYQEDELDPFSLNDSRFDMPHFAAAVEVDHQRDLMLANRVMRIATVNHEESDDESDETCNDPSDEACQKSAPGDDNNYPRPKYFQRYSSKDKPKTTKKKKSLGETVSDEFAVLEIDRRIDALEHVCLQRTIGHWTYEWCWEEKIRKFISKHDFKDPLRPTITVEKVSILGVSRDRSIKVIRPEDNEEEEDAEEGELGEATESYTMGDTCDQAGRTARTVVTMFCCTPAETRRLNKRSTFISGIPTTYPIAAIVDVWQKDPCNYEMYICTPLLCRETDVDEYDETLGLLREQHEQHRKDEEAKQAAMSRAGVANASLLSVSQILEKTIGGSCLYSNKDGWWTYEYCHKKYIRQFNGVEKSKPGSINLQDDSQFILGFYDKEMDEMVTSDEWKYVVNVTDGLGHVLHHASTQRGGNGAFFEMEYTDGEMCILEHATDDDTFDAIVRASSIRYSCGTAFSLTVREDSTCHYVVEVTVPALCDHPLFKAAIKKKRVIKCLRIDEGHE